MSSLRNKIFRNLSGYGYSQGATIVAQIVVVPFFLAAWGVRLYGEWLVLTSIPMFLALMELGVAQASATRASLASGSKDITAIRRILDTAMAFSVVTSITVATLGTILATSIPWSKWLNLSDIDPSAASVIFIYMSFYLAGNFLAAPVSAWMKAMDRTALAAVWMANRRVAEIIVTAVTLYLGASPTTLAIFLMLTSFVTLITCYAIALRHSTSGAMTMRYASRKEFRIVFWPAVSFMAMPLAQVITLQGSVQLLNALSGGIAVASFSMARTMVRLLMQVGVVFNSAMRPEISRLMGQGKVLAARSVVKKGTIVASLLVLTGLLGVGLVGPKALEIWSHGNVILPASFLILLALHAVVNVIWYVPSTLIFAKNGHSSISWYYMTLSIIALTLWWLNSSLTTPMIGAAIMMLIPETLMLCLLLKIYTKSLKGTKNESI